MTLIIKNTNHRLPPLLTANGIHKVILATSRRPNRRHLAQAGAQGEVAQDAEDEAVEEGHRAARRQDETNGAGQCDPRVENGKGHGDHCQARQPRAQMTLRGRSGRDGHTEFT